MSAEKVNRWDVPSLGAQVAIKPNSAQQEAEKKKGYDEGYQEGLNHANQVFSQKLQALEQLCAQLSGVSEQLDASCLETIEQYCQKVIETILLVELKENHEVLHQLLEKGLKQLKSDAKITVTLHPDLLESHAEHLNTLLKDKGVELQPSSNVQLSQIILSNNQQSLKSDLLALVSQYFNPSTVSKADD